MTAVDDHRATAQERSRAAEDEDWWADLMPEAAELVITSGLASTRMLQRKMRLPHDMVVDLLTELADLDVVGQDVDGERQVLVGEDGLAEVLATISDLAAGGETAAGADDVAPVVSLAKDTSPDTSPGASDEDDDWWDDEQPGGELALRPDDDLVPYEGGQLAPYRPERQHLVTRTIQATRRGRHWATHQPTLQRGAAVTIQTPKAAGLLIKNTPRGIHRSVRMTSDWLQDATSASLMKKHSDAGEGDQYAKVAAARQQANLTGRRTLVGVLAALVLVVACAWWAPRIFAGVLAVLVGGGLVVLVPRRDLKEFLYGLTFAGGAAALAWFQGPNLAALVPQPPAWCWWMLGGVLIVVFGLIGRKDDQKLVEMPATMAKHEAPAVTAPYVFQALVDSIPKIKDADQLTLLMDISRDEHGHTVDIELAPGVPATDVIENREEFAAALRRELGTVWPEVGPRHPGHLACFLGHKPMATAQQAAWPIANGGPISLFDPHPLFTDRRGRWVKQALAYTSWVIGAVPRMGKTRCLLSFGLLASFDLRARLYVYDLKGTGDLSALAKVAHKYRSGDEPEDIARMLADLRKLRQDMRDRARAVRELTLEQNPDKGKVTDALATLDPELFGLRVILVDEVQVWNQEFSDYLPGEEWDGKGKRPKDPGQAVREEFIRIQRDLVKRGPALGFILVDATQKPDAASIPSSIADNAVMRLCFKVFGQISNDQILGTSSYRDGIRATQFAFTDKGIAYLRGDGAEPIVVRSVDIDPVKADKIADRSRALRIAAGLLTGDAADDGIDDAILVTDIVEDAIEVMRNRGRGKAQHGELVQWLRELRPEDYEALDVEELSARLRGRRITISQIRIGTTNRKGVWLSDLEKPAASVDA